MSVGMLLLLWMVVSMAVAFALGSQLRRTLGPGEAVPLRTAQRR